MRVLLTTWDFSGHLYPLVPLGQAFRAAGHEVLVAADPSFAPTVVATGLPVVPVGRGFDSAQVLVDQIKRRDWQPTGAFRRTNDIEEDTRRTRRRSLLGLKIAANAADAQADDLVAFARRWKPDLVVYEPAGFAGPLVAKLLGIPAVRHLWSVDLTRELGGMESDILGDLAARFGLDEVGVNGTMTLDPCPSRVQVTDDMVRHPIRLIPHNGMPATPSWLIHSEPDKPRICVTWGTSMDRLGFGKLMLTPLVAEALADEDVEVVLAVSDRQRETFGTLPDNVRYAGPVPLNLLLPSCAALVQQGGAGTTMTGLLAGTPQLVVAHMPDGAHHGHQIEAGGVGRFEPGAEATAGSIREHVLKLLSDPGYRDAALDARADILARPTAAEVVGQLAELVR